MDGQTDEWGSGAVRGGRRGGRRGVAEVGGEERCRAGISPSGGRAGLEETKVPRGAHGAPGPEAHAWG